MKRFLVLLSLFWLSPVLAEQAGGNSSVPEGCVAYIREEGGWVFGSWFHRNSKAVHGRLLRNGEEVVGKSDGQTIKTSFGTLVWRGRYSPKKVFARSTGWLFVASSEGPLYIRDRYNPKANALED